MKKRALPTRELLTWVVSLAISVLGSLIANAIGG